MAYRTTSRVRCSVSGCTSSWKIVKMFRFPSDYRYEDWVLFCRNTKLGKRPHICALHFEKRYFLGEDRFNNFIRSSKPVPTLRSPSKFSNIEKNLELFNKAEAGIKEEGIDSESVVNSEEYDYIIIFQ